MNLRNVVAMLACGCGGVSNNPQPDAALSTIDASGTDGQVVPTPYRYVMSAQLIPASNTEARTYGLDINGDATVDNQFGALLGTLAANGFDAQAPATRAVDRGEVLMLIDMTATSFTNGPATFTLYTGDNPQPAPCTGTADNVCRRHLAGTATFDVSATSAHDTPLDGSFASSTMLSSDGQLQVQMGMDTNVVTLDLIGARAKVSAASAGAITSGVIAGAITAIDMDTKIIPAWAASWDGLLAAHCSGTTCSCTASSQAQSVQDLFDANNDCSITATELRNNSLMQSLTAPDVNIGGEDAVSYGIGFTAVSATFTP